MNRFSHADARVLARQQANDRCSSRLARWLAEQFRDALAIKSWNEQYSRLLRRLLGIVKDLADPIQANTPSGFSRVGNVGRMLIRMVTP